MQKAHLAEKEAVLSDLKSDIKKGISDSEAAQRRQSYGPNTLEEKDAKSPLSILFDQVKEIMVIILVIAAVVSMALHEYIDGVVILIIVVLNTVLGFWQEFNAEKAMAALKKMSQPEVRVRRNGVEKIIPSSELVPGDIILVEAGNLIPADARIIEAVNLKIQESALTGESEPVEKSSETLNNADIALADRKNMAYMGTIVTYGRGTAVITSTGMKTELGNIAGMLQSVEDERTPLQKRLAKVGATLAGLSLVLIAVVAVLSYFRGLHLKEIFMTSISMAVAAIPEGLPAVVTIALAFGARRMLKKKALIRNLTAVETLGSVTVICSDKTGTLTQNKMTVTDVLLPEKKFTIDEAKDVVDNTPALQATLLAGMLCNDAVLKENDESSGMETIGDPTEGALVMAAAEAGLEKKTLEGSLQRVTEFPFDSDRKRMSTAHKWAPDKHLKKSADLLAADGKTEHEHIMFTKGSVDGLVEVCSHILVNGKITVLTEKIKDNILSDAQEKSSNGVRVLGAAYRFINEKELKDITQAETGLIYLGMSCMIDPVRPEAVEAVRLCKQAGVRVVMITGDHPLTASAIGKQLGLAENDKYLTGKELSKMSVKKLKEQIHDVSIFARVSPEHKMIIIDALQEENQIVSMTGDGVNDAPALKSADIGVAMGITGTDVSKEASDMVLLDDNFATIVAAVKEGRTIFDNIRKFIKYILTGNLGEIIAMLVGPFLGMPLPLLPIQILWINLVTDGAPAVALGYEASERDIMKRTPFKPTEGLFSRGIGRQILMMGSLVGLISITVGFIFWKMDPASGAWQTMVFTTLTFCQLSLVLGIRKSKESIFSGELFKNNVMLMAVVSTFVLQLVLIYVPFFNTIFRTMPLSLAQLGICLAASLTVLIVVEVEKFVVEKK